MGSTVVAKVGKFNPVSFYRFEKQNNEDSYEGEETHLPEKRGVQ